MKKVSMNFEELEAGNYSLTFNKNRLPLYRTERYNRRNGRYCENKYDVGGSSHGFRKR